MSGRLLAIDVGNSRIKLGLFDPDEIVADRLPRCRQSTHIPLEAELPWGGVREWLEPDDTLHGIIAGANPHGIQRVVEKWPANDWPLPTVFERTFGDVLNVKLEAPEKVGIDRLLNAVAVNAVRKRNSPAIIVSSGTATTVDWVDAEGAFAGGAILPGFEMSARALHDYTALLPLIAVDELAGGAPTALGLDTRHALRSGLFWGQLGAVRELVSQFTSLSSRPAKIFLTGGGAELLAFGMRSARWEPHLALQGLAIAHASQSPESKDRVNTK